MDQALKRLADKMEKSGYLPHIRSLARMPTCPVFWSTMQPDGRARILSNGTFVFLQLGDKIVGVTNSHVYQQYVLDKEEFGDVECQIGSVTIALEKHLISQGDEIDLATFDVPDVLLSGSGSRAHSVAKWPTPRAVETEIYICGGYPGNRRTAEPMRVLNDFVSFIGRITTVSERHMGFQLNLQETHWPQGVSIDADSDLGGFSGGPVFRCIEQPIERLEIIGFIYQSGFNDILLAIHSQVIDLDGRIPY